MIQPTTNLEEGKPEAPSIRSTGCVHRVGKRTSVRSACAKLRADRRRLVHWPDTALWETVRHTSSNRTSGTDLPEYRYGAPWLDAGYHTPAISDRAALYEWHVTRLEHCSFSQSVLANMRPTAQTHFTESSFRTARGTHQKRRSITVSGPARTLASHATTWGLERIYAERTRRR